MVRTIFPGALTMVQTAILLCNQIKMNEDFLHNIIWSDKNKFTNCGVCNRKHEQI